jgi:hypothetical protein
LPAQKKIEFAITIPNNNCFNLSQRLIEAVQKKITIGVSSDGKTLALKEDIEKGYNVPKSGVIKASNVIDAIKTRGIRLPAHYLVRKEDDFWVAALIPPVKSPSLPKKTPKKPRVNGLSTMLPTGGNT